MQEEDQRRSNSALEFALPSQATEQRVFLCVTLVGFLVLVGMTWKLWLPQTVFPQIPFFSALVTVPGWVDWLTLVAAAASSFLAVIVLATQRLQGFLKIVGHLFLGALFVSVLLDQHRLQPWAYLSWLLVLAFLWLGQREAIRWSRYLFISVYAFSAFSKLDTQFCYTVGSQMVESASSFVLLGGRLPSDILPKVALILPIGELCVAIGLGVPRTTKAASYLAVAMHFTLLIVLGFGMRQNPSVLVWNVVMSIQVFVLFNIRSVAIGTERSEPKSAKGAKNGWQCAIKFALYGLLLLPLGERFGYCDHWVAWALYAPHSSRVQIEVAPNRIDGLPESLFSLASAPPESDAEDGDAEDGEKNVEDVRAGATGRLQSFRWRSLPINRWSLETLGVPVYPQSRFQFGVAISIAREVDRPFDVRATILSAANRFTGQRESKSVDGTELSRWHRRKFFFNVLPRTRSSLGYADKSENR